MKIQYLSKSQYETLLGGGTVTVTAPDGTTTKTISYSNEDVHVVEVGVYRHDIYIEHLYGDAEADYTNVYLSFISDDPNPIVIVDNDNLEDLLVLLDKAYPHGMVPITYGRTGTAVLSAMQLQEGEGTVTLYGAGASVRDGVTETPSVQGFEDSVVKIL